MRANAIGVWFAAGFRFRLCGSSLFQPVVMFLNDEGRGQQALKGLLVQCQIGPIRGHGIGGREIAETDAIVMQVWAVSKAENQVFAGVQPQQRAELLDRDCSHEGRRWL